MHRFTTVRLLPHPGSCPTAQVADALPPSAQVELYHALAVESSVKTEAWWRGQIVDSGQRTCNPPGLWYPPGPRSIRSLIFEGMVRANTLVVMLQALQSL